MARMIPIGETTELPFEAPDTTRLDKGLAAPTEPPRSLGSAGPQYDRVTAANAYQGPPRPVGLRAPVAEALASEARAPSFLRDPAGGLRAAGRTTGEAVAGGLKQTSSALQSLGGAAGQGAIKHGGKILGAAAVTAAHGNAFFDDNVPLGDKLRIGATDALAFTGAAAGGVFGGAAGSVVPVAGSLAGGLAGGYVGEKYGRKLGNAVFGGDDAQRRNGYDPERGLFDVGKDVVQGKGAAAFGSGAAPYPDAQGIRSAFGNAPRAPASVATDAAPSQAAGNSPNTVVAPLAPNAAAPQNGLGATPVADTGIRVTPTLDAASQSALSAAKFAAAGRVDPGAVGADGLGGITGFDGGENGPNSSHNRNFDSNRRQYLLEKGLNSTSQSIRAASANGIAQGDQTRTADKNTASAERIAGLRERGDTQRAIAANTTNRFIHQQTNATAERGQDLGLMGHRMSNDVAVAQARRDQGNKDREFQQGQYKLGEELDDKAVGRRADAVKNLHAEIAGMLPSGADGKPDLDAAARYATGLNAAVGDRQRALQTELQRNPANAGAASELAGLKKHGMNALDPAAKQRFIDGMKAKDLRDQNHSALNPFGGTAVQSNAPVAGLRLKKGLFTDDYQTLDANGRHDGGSIPARVVDRPGSTFGLGGRRDNSYDSLKRN